MEYDEMGLGRLVSCKVHNGVPCTALKYTTMQCTSPSTFTCRLCLVGWYGVVWSGMGVVWVGTVYSILRRWVIRCRRTYEEEGLFPRGEGGADRIGWVERGRCGVVWYGTYYGMGRGGEGMR